MAEFTRRTILANPARSVIMPKRRKFTPAQIAAGFGGKRRKAAVTRTSTKRRNPDDNFQKHLDAARLKRWKADKKAEKTAKAKRVAAIIAAKRKPLRSNPGDIITLALANPSATRNTKGHTTTMARRKKRSTTAVTPTRRRRITTRRRTRKNPVQVAHRRRARRVAAPRRRASSTRRRTRRNPSISRSAGGIGSVVQQGMWAIGGAVASKLLTQALLGASNTGFMGYGGNLASAFALGAVTKMLLHNQAAGNAVILGGVIQTLLRVLIDKTPFGSRVSNLGMGDYMAQNYLTPQRLVDGLNSAQLAPPVMPVAAAPAGMSGIYGGSLY